MYSKASSFPRLQWVDGSSCGYAPYWAPNQPSTLSNTDESIVYMHDGFYYITYAETIRYPFRACQEPAYTLIEYFNSCETLDKCIQINKSS